IAMDWERMIRGHPGPGGRLGTKKDAQDHLAYLQELSAEEKGCRRRKMPRCGDERDQAAEVREVGQLRKLFAWQHRALLLLVEPWLLKWRSNTQRREYASPSA